jgi:predicted Ser/Thr protein kinase
LDQFISKNKLKWIPYNKFENIEFLDKGEYGVVYKAIYENYEVIFKYFNYFNNSSDESLNEFLNEVCLVLFIFFFL